MKDSLVFVDGELYTGKVVFDNCKGIGWSGGLTTGLYLEKKLAARYQEVYVVNLHYNKLRKYVYKSDEPLKSQLQAETTYWDIVAMPGD